VFEPVKQWLGHEGQILRLETIENEVPQMSWLSFVRLRREPTGKIPQDDGDGYEVSFLRRLTGETSQPPFPGLQSMCG
jgi:hypothetical protein